MPKYEPFIAINAKTYRHFAVITICLTGAIALIADGEKRETVANTAVAVAKYTPEKPKTPSLIIKADTTKNANMDAFYREGSYNLDSFSDGNGGSNGGSIGGNTSLASVARVSKIDARRLASVGLTRKQFDALSPQEKERILRKLNQGMSVSERNKTIENATAKSLARSGVAQSSDF